MREKMMDTNVTVSSPTLDYFLDLGAAVDALMRASLEKPGSEMVLRNGLIVVRYQGGAERRFGLAGIELTSNDWHRAAAAF